MSLSLVTWCEPCSTSVDCRFVSALLLLAEGLSTENHRLFSAGGEDELYIWNLHSMTLESTRDVSLLRQFARVDMPKRSQDAAQRPPRKGRRGRGKQRVQQEESAQTIETLEVEEQSPKQDDPRPIVVNHIFPLSEHWIGLTSAGYDFSSCFCFGHGNAQEHPVEQFFSDSLAQS